MAKTSIEKLQREEWQKLLLNKWQREDYLKVSKIVHVVIVTYKASKFLTNKQKKGAPLHENWSTTYVRHHEDSEKW